jgi:hypothetical protein
MKRTKTRLSLARTTLRALAPDALESAAGSWGSSSMTAIPTLPSMCNGCTDVCLASEYGRTC